MFVVGLGAIGEGRAGHGQQVGVRGHQRGLRGAQQAPAGTTQAAAAGQRGPDHRGRWRREKGKVKEEVTIYFTFKFLRLLMSLGIATHL